MLTGVFIKQLCQLNVFSTLLESCKYKYDFLYTPPSYTMEIKKDSVYKNKQKKKQEFARERDFECCWCLWQVNKIIFGLFKKWTAISFNWVFN